MLVVGNASAGALYSRRLLRISTAGETPKVCIVAFSGVTMSVHYTWRPPEPIKQQLRLAHELRQELVSMRLAYEADLQAIWSSFPVVAAAEQQLAKAEAAWAAAAEAAKSERIQLKRPIPRSDAETSAMAALLAADQLPAPAPLRKALHTIDIHLTETIDQARLLPKTA